MLHRHTISFKNAYSGVLWALRTQPNYRVHLTLALLSLVGGFYYQISYFEMLIIVLLITMGLSIETINTAIESTNDVIDTKVRPDIKIAKDLAAGAMLFFSLGAFIIACMIFIPRIV